MLHGKTIKLFLMENSTEGFTEASISGRLCIGYKIPREEVSKCKNYNYLNQTGIYFLFGEDSKGNPEMYVGQAAQRKNGLGLSQRLCEHDNAKEDYWTEAVALTATDDSLNPMMIWYLENWFYERAKAVGNYRLHNANTPNPGKVTLAEEAALQDYIDDVLLIVKILGYYAFEKKNRHKADAETDGTRVFCRSKTADAQAIFAKNGKLVVLQGSRISETVQSSLAPSLKKKRDEMIVKGIISDNVFRQNWDASSVSMAAALILGYRVNGKNAWKTTDGVKIGDLMNVASSQA